MWIVDRGIPNTQILTFCNFYIKFCKCRPKNPPNLLISVYCIAYSTVYTQSDKPIWVNPFSLPLKAPGATTSSTSNPPTPTPKSPPSNSLNSLNRGWGGGGKSPSRKTVGLQHPLFNGSLAFKWSKFCRRF